MACTSSGEGLGGGVVLPLTFPFINIPSLLRHEGLGELALYLYPYGTSVAVFYHLLLFILSYLHSSFYSDLYLKG